MNSKKISFLNKETERVRSLLRVTQLCAAEPGSEAQDDQI